MLFVSGHSEYTAAADMRQISTCKSLHSVIRRQVALLPRTGLHYPTMIQ